MKLILSGFLPFRNQKINPSQLIVEDFDINSKSLNKDSLKFELINKPRPFTTESIELEKVILPVEYDKSWQILKLVLEKNLLNLQTDFCILLFGQALGRKNVSLERYAHNLADSEFADEANDLKLDLKINRTAELALETGLSLRQLVNSAKLNNQPIEISYSAGAFVCNFLYFKTLNWLKQNNLEAKALFVHLPLIKEQISFTNKIDTNKTDANNTNANNTDANNTETQNYLELEQQKNSIHWLINEIIASAMK